MARPSIGMEFEEGESPSSRTNAKKLPYFAKKIVQRKKEFSNFGELAKLIEVIS